ncbi:MAG: HAD family phosphatase [Flavobacteriales bacterium]|jgi:putative hydrolase of the HAD superfamily|nr:HAD family phosphatase [Flavobacteriales bacterium]MCB9363714.1 HAD family phosphatase [Flavobacteriales bacterium]
MFENIKNIILDLGGVIINLNQELTYRAFKQLFPTSYEEILKELNNNNYLEKFETSEISSIEFITFFKSFDSSITSENIIKAWNSMLLDIPEERIELIQNLAKNYNVYLLSNTNEIHYQFIDEYVSQKFNGLSFKSLFKHAYLSHKIHLRKPNQAIFNYVLQQSKLSPQETLFIDDTLEHINSAKQLGIQTHHLNLQENQTLNQFFNEH